MTAIKPDEQTLLTVIAFTLGGRPAFKADCLAGFWPIPACTTQPMITSSTSNCTPVLCTAAFIAAAPSSGAGTEESEPHNDPIGVRAAPTITTSRGTMENLLVKGLRAAKNDYGSTLPS
jgi:hypothetical protein